MHGQTGRNWRWVERLRRRHVWRSIREDRSSSVATWCSENVQLFLTAQTRSNKQFPTLTSDKNTFSAFWDNFHIFRRQSGGDCDLVEWRSFRFLGHSSRSLTIRNSQADCDWVQQIQNIENISSVANDCAHVWQMSQVLQTTGTGSWCRLLVTHLAPSLQTPGWTSCPLCLYVVDCSPKEDCVELACRSLPALPAVRVPLKPGQTLWPSVVVMEILCVTDEGTDAMMQEAVIETSRRALKVKKLLTSVFHLPHRTCIMCSFRISKWNHELGPKCYL